jgi:glycopeptide antibiotics resistance protein
MILMNSPIVRYRLVLAVNAALLIPIGYGMRFSPVLPEWIRNISGNIAYEMLLVMLVLLVAPRVLPRGAAIGVCLTSFGLEFLQLSQTPLLVAARENRLGRLILGNGFTWDDFPLYVLGSVVGYLWATWIRKMCLGPIDRIHAKE